MKLGHIIVADIHIAKQLLRNILPEPYRIVVLDILRLLVCLAVQIYDMILDLQCLSRKTHTALHIILAPVHWTPSNLAEVLPVVLDIVAGIVYRCTVEMIAVNLAHAVQVRGQPIAAQIHRLALQVVVAATHVLGNSITRRIVEHHDIVQLHRLRAYTLVIPLKALDIALAQIQRQRMLAQRSMQGSLRNTGTISHLAHKQIVTHQQALLQRA